MSATYAANNAPPVICRVNWYIVLMTLSMFMTGASGMVVEYVLSTVSSYLNGSSVESFSLTIAIMMGMMGLGGWAQRFVSDENIIDKFVYLELALAVISAFSPIAVYAAFSYMPEHYQLVYYFFVMSIGFMVGFEIVYPQIRLPLRSKITLIDSFFSINRFFCVFKCLMYTPK